MLGERTAEEIKVAIGSAFPLEDEPSAELRGRDLISGLPKTIVLTSEEVRMALEEPLQQIIDAVKETLDRTPPELSSDIMDRGIMLAGGGSLLQGLDEHTAAHLRRRMTVRRIWADPGSWTPDRPDDAEQGHLGLLVIDGLLARTVHLGGREGSEVVGPGDLIRPWDREDWMSVECGSEWRVLIPTTFAALDRRFALRAARWPTIMAQLLGRSTRRHDDCNHTVADNCACHIQCAINRRIYSVSRDILKIHSQHIPEPLA